MKTFIFILLVAIFVPSSVESGDADCSQGPDTIVGKFFEGAASIFDFGNEFKRSTRSVNVTKIENDGHVRQKRWLPILARFGTWFASSFLGRTLTQKGGKLSKFFAAAGVAANYGESDELGCMKQEFGRMSTKIDQLQSSIDRLATSFEQIVREVALFQSYKANRKRIDVLFTALRRYLNSPSQISADRLRQKCLSHDPIDTLDWIQREVAFPLLQPYLLPTIGKAVNCDNKNLEEWIKLITSNVATLVLFDELCMGHEATYYETYKVIQPLDNYTLNAADNVTFNNLIDQLGQDAMTYSKDTAGAIAAALERLKMAQAINCNNDKKTKPPKFFNQDEFNKYIMLCVGPQSGSSMAIRVKECLDQDFDSFYWTVTAFKKLKTDTSNPIKTYDTSANSIYYYAVQTTADEENNKRYQIVLHWSNREIHHSCIKYHDDVVMNYVKGLGQCDKNKDEQWQIIADKIWAGNTSEKKVSSWLSVVQTGSPTLEDHSTATSTTSRSMKFCSDKYEAIIQCIAGQ